MSEVQAQQQSSQQSSSSSSMSSATTSTAADRSSLSSAPSASIASSSTSTQGDTQPPEKQDQEAAKVNDQFLRMLSVNAYCFAGLTDSSRSREFTKLMKHS